MRAHLTAVGPITTAYRQAAVLRYVFGSIRTPKIIDALDIIVVLVTGTRPGVEELAVVADSSP